MHQKDTHIIQESTKMPDMNSVGSALLITLGFLTVSVLVVGAAMWWLYRFFKNNDDQDIDKK